MPTNSTPALALEGLTFGYPERPGVLQEVTLTVQPAERVGLVGPNGSGKTSLLLLICGLLTPGAGTMRLFGQPVVPGQFQPDVGLVWQNPDEQLFCPSVGEDVAFGPTNLGLPPDAVAARVEMALQATGVAHLAGRVPHHLSGGEKRMVAIAGIVAMQPQLMLYDEPDAFLDQRARRRLQHFIATYPAACLLASHDLELVAEVCQRIVVLDGGRIVATGTPRAVLGDATLMDAHGLAVPAIYR